MTLFELIRKDHDYQRELLNKLIDTSGDSADRRRLYEQVKTELQIHEDVEEKNFYKHLIDSEATIEMVRHGMAEHHEIDELIESLDNTEMDSSSWLNTAKKLKDQVEHHLKDEEQEFFKIAGKELSDSKKEELARQYEKDLIDAKENQMVVER